MSWEPLPIQWDFPATIVKRLRPSARLFFTTRAVTLPKRLQWHRTLRGTSGGAMRACSTVTEQSACDDKKKEPFAQAAFFIAFGVVFARDERDALLQWALQWAQKLHRQWGLRTHTRRCTLASRLIATRVKLLPSYGRHFASETRLSSNSAARL